MDQAAAQARVKQLVEMAVRAPLSEEGRSAAIAAWKLVREAGLLIVRLDELTTFVTPPSLPTKKRRRSRKTTEVIGAAAEGIVSTVDAAGRVVSAVNGLRDTLRGR